MMTDHHALLAERQLFVSTFLNLFAASSYTQVDPEPLMPRADKSVYFVGATINRFKDQMVSGAAPAAGEVLHQRCLRLFSINNILEDGQNPYFCYFTMLGAYRSADKLGEVCGDLKNFLQNGLSLSSAKINTVASENDRDIFSVPASALNPEFVKDDDKFLWRFGLPDIHGRGMLIKVESEPGKWREIGQVIHLYKDNRPFACELAIGVETLQWALQGTQDFRTHWTIQGLAEQQGSSLDWRYLDSVSTLATMYAAGALNDHSKHGQLVKKVLRNLFYICQEQNIPDDDVEKLFKVFSIIELGVDPGNLNFLTDYNKIKEQSVHNLDRFNKYVGDLTRMVSAGQINMTAAFNKAVRKADGASFVPRPVCNRILLQHGIQLVIE